MVPWGLLQPLRNTPSVAVCVQVVRGLDRKKPRAVRAAAEVAAVEAPQENRQASGVLLRGRLKRVFSFCF